MANLRGVGAGTFPADDICSDCGDEIALTDVQGHYDGKCAKCRDAVRAKDGTYYEYVPEEEGDRAAEAGGYAKGDGADFR